MQCKHEFLKEFLHFLWIGNDFVPVNKISLFFPHKVRLMPVFILRGTSY